MCLKFKVILVKKSKINHFSSPHKRIKIPRPDSHPSGAANRFVAKFKVYLIHGLVKTDALFVIFKRVDLAVVRVAVGC